MALIQCKECGHNVSDKATTCPNCGCPVEVMKNEIKKENLELQQNENHTHDNSKIRCTYCGSGNVQVQIVPHNKNAGCLTVFLYVLLALTLVGIPIMILIILVRGKKTVDKKYYVCQDCGKTFNLGNNNNSTATQILIILLFIVVSIGILSTLINAFNGSSESYVIENGEQVNKEKYKLNEEIYCREEIIKIKSVNYSSKIDNKWTPDAGEKFIEITVELKNAMENGNRTFFVSDFKLITASGTIVTPKDVSSVKGALKNSIEVTPGGTASGKIVFSIPKNDYTSTLKYTCGIWPSTIDIEIDTSKK